MRNEGAAGPGKAKVRVRRYRGVGSPKKRHERPPDDWGRHGSMLGSPGSVLDSKRIDGIDWTVRQTARGVVSTSHCCTVTSALQEGQDWPIAGRSSERTGPQGGQESRNQVISALLDRRGEWRWCEVEEHTSNPKMWHYRPQDGGTSGLMLCFE